jgi:PD-(D/E)XK endonuclease
VSVCGNRTSIAPGNGTTSQEARGARVNPSAKGARSEAAALHGRFTPIQSKTGVLRNGSVYFRTASADRRRPMGDRYVGQIDAFAVYCPELDACFLVPIEALVATQRAALRVRAPENGQTMGIRRAQQYVLNTTHTVAADAASPR